MRKVIAIVIVMFFMLSNVSYGRTVSFDRITVDSLQNGPHGTWAGNIDGTSSQYEQDIFATIGSDGKSVWYGNSGAGISWSTQNLIWDPSYFDYEIAGCDMDNDGDIDAVSCQVKTSGSEDGSIAIHKNNGNGTSWATTTLMNANGRFRQMRVYDIDGDGDSDIVATINSAQSLFIAEDQGLYWFRNAGGSFTSFYIGQANCWKVDCFDDDGDGHMDIIAGEFYHGYVASGTSAPCRLLLYKNNGAESFTEVVIDNTFPNGTEAGVSGVRCYDFDKDGNTDIVCGDVTNGIFYLYKGTGGGNFTKNTIESTCVGIDGIDVGDFNTDGKMDIVVAGRNYWLRWYENDGFANFTSHAIDAQYQLFDLPYVSYFDGDTCPDIVLSEASSSVGHIFAYLNPCIGGAVEENTKAKTSTLAVKPNIVNQNSNIKIQFSVTDISPVNLSIYDITGKTMKILINEHRTPGCYETNIDAKNIANGIYFVKLNSGSYQNIQKLIIVK
ncbi:MAG: T9SS type A sorting domain-containing protein [bacterium]